MTTSLPPVFGAPAWKALRAHADGLAGRHLRELFDAEPDRNRRMVCEACGITLDHSKNRIDEPGLALFRRLACEGGLNDCISALFSGAPVNDSEQRAALHMALRAKDDAVYPGIDMDVMAEVLAMRQQMSAMVSALRQGQWRGFSGKPIRHVVNIGIGGSDLGPSMVTEALARAHTDALTAHFVSNVDPAQIGLLLEKLTPATTLFIVTSKTFTTQETMSNAGIARCWILDANGQQVAAIGHHFIAVTGNLSGPADLGIAPGNVLPMWDWVGGRYSLWSAVGLPIAIMIGMEAFGEMLEGARAMDDHFRSAPFDRNLPVVLGLQAVWYSSVLGAETRAVLPYDAALRLFPDYLAQLDMESSGKQVSQNGERLAIATGPILWGALGNDGQHAFYQLLHQGGRLVPADIIVACHSQYPAPDAEVAMLANAVAQAEALMRGRTPRETSAALAASGESGVTPELVNQRSFPGNQPTNMLLYDRLTPAILGALIALYEHKVFVQCCCWGINPFDQWGVELGKLAAGPIQDALRDGVLGEDHDASTRALVEFIRARRDGSG